MAYCYIYLIKSIVVIVLECLHLYFTFARVQIEKTAPSSDERIGSDIIQIRMYAQIIQPPTTETNYFSDLETRTRILNYVKQRKLSR